MDPVKGIDARYYSGRLDQAFYNVQKRDEQIRPFIDGNVHAIALQTDGKILIGGSFTKVRSPVKEANGYYRYDTHYGIARLMPDGSLDTSFDAKIQPVPGGNDSFVVRSIALQDDGKILMTGTFERIGTGVSGYTYRPLIARLTNSTNPATNSLSVSSDGATITWLRGGSSPEATEVIFESRPANSNIWTLVDNEGFAERTTGGWTRTLVTPLPPFTFVRASARTTGGRYNGSSGLVSTTVGYQVQRLALMKDPSTFLTNGSTTDLGTTGVGFPSDVPFTVSNVGSATLGAINAYIMPPGNTDFSVVTPPSPSLAIAGSSAMEVRFNPTSAGTKTATLVIASDDPMNPGYTVTLTGTALTAIEQFRLTYFGTSENSGIAADGEDPDGDGLTNYFEFVAGLIPNDRTSTFTCQVAKPAGAPTVTFGPCLNNRTYEVWSSSTLNGDWAPVTGGSTAVNGTQRTFTDANPPDPKRFYRIKVTFP